MIIYADIDGTICSDESGLYEKVKPIKEQINKIHKKIERQAQKRLETLEIYRI